MLVEMTGIATISVHLPGAIHTDKYRCWVMSLKSEGALFILQGRLREVKSPAHSHRDKSWDSASGQYNRTHAVLEVAEPAGEGWWPSTGRTLGAGRQARPGEPPPASSFLDNGGTAGRADEARGHTGGRRGAGAAGAQHRVSARLPGTALPVCALPVSQGGGPPPGEWGF